MTPEQNKEIELEAVKYASSIWGTGSNSWGTAKAAYHDCATKYTAEIDRLKKELFTMEEIKRAYNEEIYDDWLNAGYYRKRLIDNLKKQKEG